MPFRDRLVVAADVIVPSLFVLNLICGALFTLALLALWPAGPAVTARLLAKYGGDFEAAGALAAIRAMLAIGVGASAAAHVILAALLRLIALVRRGDPFVQDAARQVERIGWGLLAIQLLDLVAGLVTGRLADLGAEVLDWQPSLTGWLGVLVAFVLARVFRAGTRLRDELEGVV